MQLPEDSIIREMLPDFVRSWRNDISEKYDAIVHEKNESELFRFGHTLRGSGRQFNLEMMSEFGVQIQDCSKAQDWERALLLKTPMLNALEEVEQECKRTGASVLRRRAEGHRA